MNKRDKFVSKRTADKVEEMFYKYMRDHPVFRIPNDTLKVLFEQAKSDALLILEGELLDS